MIEVRELRIGSLVDYQGETREVAQLTQYGEVWLDVEEGEQDMCQTGELYGIPLTEAWVDRLGFKWQ